MAAKRERTKFAGGGPASGPPHTLSPLGETPVRKPRRSRLHDDELGAHGRPSTGRPDRHQRRKVTEAVKRSLSVNNKTCLSLLAVPSPFF